MGITEAELLRREQSVNEWLFRRTFEDLDERVSKRSAMSRYELLGCSSILRKLLLDGHPLVDKANKGRAGRGVSISFRAHKFIARLPHRSVFHSDGIIPGNDDTQILNLSRDAWLRHKAAEFDGEAVTVKDLILFAAHVEGGVHAGKPKMPFDREWSRATWAYVAPETPQIAIRASPVGCLYGIAAVTVEALRPLYAVTEG